MMMMMPLPLKGESERWSEEHGAHDRSLLYPVISIDFLLFYFFGKQLEIYMFILL